MRQSNLHLIASLLACALTVSLLQPAVAQPSALAKSSAKSSGKVTSTNKRKIATRPSSPCRGLVKQACEGVAVCGWINPKKKTDIRGRRLTAHCRKTARTGRTRKTAVKSPARSSK